NWHSPSLYGLTTMHSTQSRKSEEIIHWIRWPSCVRKITIMFIPFEPRTRPSSSETISTMLLGCFRSHLSVLDYLYNIGGQSILRRLSFSHNTSHQHKTTHTRGTTGY